MAALPRSYFDRRSLHAQLDNCQGSSIMMIRQEQEQDRDAIKQVTADAFALVEHSNQTEPAIIAALRDAGALTISLVAAEGDEIIGHVAFSPVTIDGENRKWFGLGPVSVRPDLQGRGIGGALIRQGLEELRAQGAAGCVLLGNPGYYRRFGFENDPGLRYPDAPPEYFMRLTFEGSDPTGEIAYHAAFGAC
ncbi:GNAT family N-acetyltransferase [Novosphingobium panipatense]